MLHQNITDPIIRSFYHVYNILGYGFLEKVYQNALVIELRKMGLHVDQQTKISVYYDSSVVGEYFSDLLVEKLVIVELKTAVSICEEHEAQLLNYLKATKIEVGLLLNFGKKAEFKRKLFHNHLKKYRVK